MAGSCSDDLTDVFKYELCRALFQTIDILLEANKPALAEAIWKQLPLAVHNTVLIRLDSQFIQFLIIGHGHLNLTTVNAGVVM